MSSTWSIYTLASGLFTGQRLTGKPAAVEANIPEGCDAIAGAFDHLSQRVDIATGAVVDYTPPAPPDDEDTAHDWDADTKRWKPRRTLMANKKARRALVQAQIAEQIAEQHEPLRNLVLALAKGRAAPPAALAKAQATDDTIGTLKAKIDAIMACTTQAELDAIPL